jgi:phage replication O-like protein O
MASPQADKFVRLSTELLEVLLCSKLTGVQLRVILWVIRNTYGWNRALTPFSWYQIARDLALNRGSVYRAGETLLDSGVLILQDRRLGIQTDYEQWDRRLRTSTEATRQLWLPAISVAWEQRRALPGDNAPVAYKQPNRCLEATLFRRAKDSSKDKIKTYKDRRTRGTQSDRIRPPDYSERRLLAGAATPIPGKYGGLSQD